MIYAHNRDLEQFHGKTRDALERLRQDEWGSSNIADVNTAFGGLYDRHGLIAYRSEAGTADPECIEIRKVIHALADVWAVLWQQRGDDKLFEKLQYYYRKARFERSNAHDELLFQALKKLRPQWAARIDHTEA